MKTSIKKRFFHIIAVLMTACLLLAFVQAPVFAEPGSSNINRFNVVIVADASDSMMRTSDPNGLRYDAIRQFINLLTESGNYLGAVVFDHGIKLQKDLTEITQQSDKEAIMNEIEMAQPTQGYTDIGQAMSTAVGMLQNVNNGLPSLIILLSDGETDLENDADEPASLQKETDAIAAAQAAGIKVYTVFLNDEHKMDETNARNELEQITNGTGGALLEVNQAPDLKNVFDSFYTLIYGTAVMNFIDAAIPDGGVVEEDFVVPFEGVEEINIIINGNRVGVSLTDPNGGQDYQPLTADESYQFFKITNVIPGTWHIAVTGDPGTTIDVNMVYNFDLNIELQAASDSVSAGSTYSVSAKVKTGSEYVDPAEYIYYTDATLLIDSADGSFHTEVPMTAAGEGYTADYAFTQPGQFEVSAYAVVNYNGTPFATMSSNVLTANVNSFAVTMNTDSQDLETGAALNVTAAADGGGAPIDPASLFAVLHVVTPSGENQEYVMTGADGNFSYSLPFQSEGDYTVYVEAGYQGPAGESIQARSPEQTVTVTEPPKYAPFISEDPVKASAVKFPWAVPEVEIDLKQAVTDDKDPSDALVYEVIESSSDPGDESLATGVLTSRITNGLFDMSKKTVAVKVTDSDGMESVVNVEISVLNAGMIGIIALAVIIIAVVAIILIKRKSTLSKSFGGSIQCRSEVDGRVQGETKRKPRGRMNLSVFGMEPTGLNYNKSYFQATGSNYVFLITDKKVRYNGTETNKVRVQSGVEVLITVDPSTAKRIHIYYTCDQASGPRRPVQQVPPSQRGRGRVKSGRTPGRPVNR